MDDTGSLEAVAIDDSTASIAVCGGQDIFVYRPYGDVRDETLKVSSSASSCPGDVRTIIG